jgi:hypothetical protein
MASKTNPRIYISKTPSEWKAIDDKLAELKRANLNSFLRGKIHLLVKDYKKSHKKVCEAVEKREKRTECINSDDLKILELISVKTGLPIAQIVSQIILDPLIRSNGNGTSG